MCASPSIYTAGTHVVDCKYQSEHFLALGTSLAAFLFVSVEKKKHWHNHFFFHTALKAVNFEAFLVVLN